MLLSVSSRAGSPDAAINALAPAERDLLIAGRKSPSGSSSICGTEPLARIGDALRRTSRARINDPQWYEEHGQLPTAPLLGHEFSLARTVNNLTHMKAWKRREPMRLARVTDLIHSCYERSLTHRELAEAAHSSYFHMMREFKAVHAISPYEYLQRRRTQTAVRLLCCTDLSVAEIAERTGFHVRTLVRRLRRSRGLGARALRVRAQETNQSQQSASYRMTTGVV